MCVCRIHLACKTLLAAQWRGYPVAGQNLVSGLVHMYIPSLCSCANSITIKLYYFNFKILGKYIYIGERCVTKYFQWCLSFFKLKRRHTFWRKYFITSSKTIIIGNRSLVVLRQKISHKISTKLYHSIPFLIWRNVGTCTWIYYIRRRYTYLSHLFFLIGTSSPNLANLMIHLFSWKKMADYLLLTISKRSGFCQGCHFWTEARRWHEWNLSSGHQMTYLAATTRVIWRTPDNYFAAARELFWWPSYNASGGRYIIFFWIFKIYISESNILRFSALPRGMRGWTEGMPLTPPAPYLPSRPLSPSSLFGAARASRANFFLFLPPSFSHLSLLPPLFSLLPPPLLPPPAPSPPLSRPLISHLPLTLSATEGIFVRTLQNFLSRFTRLLLWKCMFSHCR